MSGLRRTRFAAALAVAALALAGSRPAPAQDEFGKNKIQYRKFVWRIYHSPHFDLYYYPEEEAQLEKVASFAESAYDRLSRELDYQIKEPTPLIFYATHSAFEQNNIFGGFVPEAVGAFASPVRNRMVLPIDLPDPKLQQLIAHELTHVFQYHILFQGRLGKALTANPPTWLMEGMASYMGRDEDPRDRMYLRDAVVNDLVPPITETNITGFFAYRFGHAVFDFMEQRWGKEGIRDFLFEYRNSLGSRVDKAIKKAFRLETADFDVEFRRWLRKKYLPELVRTGEPSDFGHLFRAGTEGEALQISPAASPAGDLVAAISTLRGDIDVVLFDARKRREIRALSKGPTSHYQYLVSQEFTVPRLYGRDVAFSPDGNQVAVFAKREKGRELVLLDVLHGGIARAVDLGDIEQPLAPAWSPDGKRVAFSGARNGQFDIFELDLDTRKFVNLTNDALYDGAPVYSPDGKSVVFSSVVGDHAKLFRIDLAEPGKRYQLTDGETNDRDAVFSRDGKRIYFSSDEQGIENIWSLDLATGELRQHTNAVTGCFMPTVIVAPDGSDRLVYAGYWRLRFDLYTIDAMEAIGPVRKVALPAAAAPVAQLPTFEPDIRVTVDPANQEKYHSRKLFVEDVGAQVGVNSDQTFVANTYISLTDYLGDRRLLATFSSISTFSNFAVAYANIAHRTQWEVAAFDNRTFYIAQDQSTGQIVRGRAAYEETGATGQISHPFDFYHRIDIGLTGMERTIDYQAFEFLPNGDAIPVVQPRKDTFPQLDVGLVGDTVVFQEFGPFSGRRWRLDLTYAPDLGKKEALSGINHPSGTLSGGFQLDARQYFRISQRSNLAFRLFVGVSSGNAPRPFYLGGLDTLRAFDFREIVGNRAAFANVEYRFPLGPVLFFRSVRGRVFLDVGGAYFTYAPAGPDGKRFEFWDSANRQLKDGRADYGWGISIPLGGFDLNWDFAKQWRFVGAKPGFQTSFWVGAQF